MTGKLWPLLAAFVFSGGVALMADDVPKPYLDPAKVDSRRVLPTPPANDSSDTVKEMEIILQAQADRTPEQVARIEAEKTYDVMAFGNVVGPLLGKVDDGKLPATSALLAGVTATAKPIAETAANDWDRTPPFAVNARIFPAIAKPAGGSYPSPESTQATVDALVLAQLVPDDKQAILARGRQIGDDRVVAGVQFPSDVIAGRVLGQAVFNAMMRDPRFRSDLAAARAEVKGARN